MFTFNVLLWFVTKILVILCFPYLQNDDVTKLTNFDTNFNTIIKIRVINYFYLPSSTSYFCFITKILAFHIFIVFILMTSSDLIDLRVTSNFNTISEISIISYLYIRNFRLIRNLITKILAISYFHCV